MQYLQFGNAFSMKIVKPGLFFLKIGGKGVIIGYPAIAFTKKSYEKGSARPNLIKAELQRLFPGALLFSDTPSHIDFDQFDLSLPAKPPQLRSGVAHKLIAFLHHIAKS